MPANHSPQSYGLEGNQSLFRLMEFSYLYLRALRGPVGIREPWDHLECLYVPLRALLEKEMWDSEQTDLICALISCLSACQGLKGERGSPGNVGQKGESVSPSLHDRRRLLFIPG